MWRTFDMRLINTETLAIDDADDVLPQSYAILSHTWDQDEVTFQDMADLETARRKAGFAKIEMVCKLARLDGFRYAWIDTCCIDKTSSAELSEAINSMFAWYQESALCYIYL